MAAITKNVFSNQFSISFPITSCYLLKMTKKYSTPIWSRVVALARRYSSSELFISCRLTAAHIIIVNCSVSLLDLCDAAALILSTVFYLLKQVALSFVGRSCRMITAHTTVHVGGIIRS